MKKVLVNVFVAVALLATAALVTPQTQAQEPVKSVSFMLGAGIGMPTGDLSDGWKMGFHGTGRVGFEVAPKIDILAGLDYHLFPIDDMGDASVDGGTLSTLNIGGDAKLNLGTPEMSANPFLLGGFGMAIYTISDLTYDDPGLGTVTVSFSSETDLFIEIGGGVEFNQFFLEGRYVNIFSEGSSISYIPFSLGVKF